MTNPPSDNHPSGAHENAAMEISPAVVALLQFMLGVMSRCQNALLQEETETRQVIEGTLAQFLGPAVEAPSGSESGSTVGRLDHLLSRILRQFDESKSQTELLGQAVAAAPENAGEGQTPQYSQILASWFHELSLLLRKSHPKAVEMLRLRFTGLGSREIAAQLDLPPRLVHHVLRTIADRQLRDSASQEASS